MKTKIFSYILIIFILCTKQVISFENKIILKVNDRIITTVDIKQEEKYLIVLNPNQGQFILHLLDQLQILKKC